MPLLACPPLNDLADPDRTNAVRSHLEACVRCRTLLREMDDGRREPLTVYSRERFLAGSYARPTTMQAINDVDPGRLVTASTGDEDERLVCALLELDEYDAVAVPLSHEVVYAT